jgi:hypothetical protein
VDDGKLSERTVSDELPQVCSASSLFIGNDWWYTIMGIFWQETDKIEQDGSHPEQDGISMNGTPGNAVSSDATPAENGESKQRLHSTLSLMTLLCWKQFEADHLISGNYEGAESVAAKPKKSSGTETDQNKVNPSDKSEATADSDTKKEDPASSVEAANGAADDTSGPVADTPGKRRGRPPGPKSLEKKAAGKNHPSSDVKKTVEATDSAGKISKHSAKDDVKSPGKKAGEGESSKKHLKISSKEEKDETLSEEDPSKDVSLKVSL